MRCQNRDLEVRSAWNLTASLYSISDSASFASLIQRHNASFIDRTTGEQQNIGEVVTILSIRRNIFCTTSLRAVSMDSSAGYTLINQSFASANGSDGNGPASFNSTQETTA